MTTIKQIIRFPARMVWRYRLAGEVCGYDEVVDRDMVTPNQLYRSGWMKTTIDELFESPGLCGRMRDSEMRVRPEESKGIYWSWAIPEFLWTALLSSQRLQSLVFGYLGPQARLDDFYVKSIIDGLRSGAEGWHDDNVGYRLKIFMVFDKEGVPSDTLLIPRGRPNPYRVKFYEEALRMLGMKDKRPRESEVRINYSCGDCLVFDTNLTHRGDYSGAAGVRYCVVAEFIDRKKADFLRGRAPCGPGQSRHRIVIQQSDDVLLKGHPFIDPNILIENGGQFSYGYR